MKKRKYSRSVRPTVKSRSVIFGDSATKRSIRHDPIPLNITSQPTSTSIQPPSSNTSIATEPLEPPHDDPEPAPPGKYSRQKNATLESWNNIRDSLLETSIELSTPISFTCTVCHMTEDLQIYRCKECGPAAMFCIECLRIHHQELRSFHVPEKWEGTHFSPYQLHHTIQLPHHASCTQRPYCRSLRVFDQAGRLQYTEVTFCNCEPPSCTLLRYGLWASTVSDPQTAFSTSLLEWLVMLTMEAQVSVDAFCRAVRYKNHLSNSERKTLYRALIGQSIAEFRHLMYRMRTMTDLCPLLDNGTACPACPKMEGSQIISLDGNFGLVRKKSSGTSTGPPLHGTSVFLSDDHVEQFMESYNKESKPDEDCSNFKAGNAVRSQAKQTKLDVTGVFGSVCRHEVPRLFLNMSEGERLGYPVCLIQQLLSGVEGNVDLKIIYDISCILVAHLKRTKQDDLLAQLTVALDVFHAYGHKTACQLKYSTRRLPGFGLTDGEAVERMWSFLRKFSRTTKEMTPSRRIDLLTDALIHYTMRKTLDIEVALVAKMENAKKADSVADEGLSAVMNEANVSIDEIRAWSEREWEAISVQKVPTSTVPIAKWKKQYVTKLLKLKAFREKMDARQDDSDAAVYVKLDKELTKFEKKKKVKKRWTFSSKKFITVMKEVDAAVRTTLLSKMRGLAYERSCLLSCKRRHADGQAIATTVTKKLKTANSNLKKTIASYNEIEWDPATSTFPKSVKFQEAKDSSWQQYLCLEPTVLEESGVSPSLLRKGIEHLNLRDRATEEKEMVQQEMRAAFQHFQNQREMMEDAVDQFGVDEAGKRAALTTNIVRLEKRIESMYYFLKQHVPDLDLPLMPSSLLTVFPFQQPEDVNMELCETLYDNCNGIPSDEEGLSDFESDESE